MNINFRVQEVSPTANFNVEKNTFNFCNNTAVSISNDGSLNPSYEIRCNKIKNSSIGIRVEANSIIDDLGGNNSPQAPDLPSANKWTNVSTEINSLTNVLLQGNYYKASNENISNSNIIPVNTSININNSCQ